jgi:hypothetical protein
VHTSSDAIADKGQAEIMSDFMLLTWVSTASCRPSSGYGLTLR